MGMALGDPTNREHKANHNSSTIEDKNPGNKKMEEVGSMLASCTLVVRGRGHGREVKRKIKFKKMYRTSKSDLN